MFPVGVRPKKTSSSLSRTLSLPRCTSSARSITLCDSVRSVSDRWAHLGCCEGSELRVCSCFAMTPPRRQSAPHYLTCFHGGGRKPVTSEAQYIHFDFNRMCNTQTTCLFLSPQPWDENIIPKLLLIIWAVCAPDTMGQMETPAALFEEIFAVSAQQLSKLFYKENYKSAAAFSNISQSLQQQSTFWSFPATVDNYLHSTPQSLGGISISKFSQCRSSLADCAGFWCDNKQSLCFWQFVSPTVCFHGICLHFSPNSTTNFNFMKILDKMCCWLMYQDFYL